MKIGAGCQGEGEGVREMSAKCLSRWNYGAGRVYNHGEKTQETLMKYKVNVKKTDEGYAVWVPGLPGCWSQGKTEKEALENIKDAIESYLETVDELSKDKKSRYVEVG